MGETFLLRASSGDSGVSELGEKVGSSPPTSLLRAEAGVELVSPFFCLNFSIQDGESIFTGRSVVFPAACQKNWA